MSKAQDRRNAKIAAKRDRHAMEYTITDDGEALRAENMFEIESYVPRALDKAVKYTFHEQTYDSAWTNGNSSRPIGSGHVSPWNTSTLDVASQIDRTGRRTRILKQRLLITVAMEYDSTGVQAAGMGQHMDFRVFSVVDSESQGSQAANTDIFDAGVDHSSFGLYERDGTHTLRRFVVNEALVPVTLVEESGKGAEGFGSADVSFPGGYDVEYGDNTGLTFADVLKNSQQLFYNWDVSPIRGTASGTNRIHIKAHMVTYFIDVD